MESLSRLNSELEPVPRGTLTTVSYCVLGLVGEQGEGAHDLVRILRRGAVYYAIAPSQIYAEPKRLEKLGYLTSRTEPGKTKPRTVYSLTGAGREALREWMSEPANFPRVQNEAAVRIMCADIAGRQRTVESLRGMRPAIQRVLEDVAVMEQNAERLPHRQANLQLNNWLGRRWCELLLEWLDEAERVLGEQGSDGRR